MSSHHFNNLKSETENIGESQLKMASPGTHLVKLQRSPPMIHGVKKVK